MYYLKSILIFLQILLSVKCIQSDNKAMNNVTLTNVEKTAIRVLNVRAVLSENGNRIFKDYFAELLTKENKYKLMNMTHEINITFKDNDYAHLSIRAMLLDQAVIDTLTEQFISEHNHKPQIVSLAAGMCTRPQRLQEKLPYKYKGHGISWFEVDTKNMIDFKNTLFFKQNNKKISSYTHVTRIACNLEFELDKLLIKLKNNGFNDKIPTIWLMEGFLYYIPPTAIKNIMYTLPNILGSKIIYTIITKDNMNTEVHKLLYNHTPLALFHNLWKSNYDDMENIRPKYIKKIWECGCNDVNNVRKILKYNDINIINKNISNKYLLDEIVSMYEFDNHNIEL